MGKVLGFSLNLTLFIYLTFFTLSSRAVNYSSTANGQISDKLLWADSLGNHPSDFIHPYDIFTIQNGHSMQGEWICHSSVLLQVEGNWNTASGNIGNILIVQGGSVTQSGALTVSGNWIQNGTYLATCDSCSVIFTGHNDQYINSNAGLDISFRLINVDLNSGFNLHVKTNIMVARNVIFDSNSSIVIYPGFFMKVNGRIIYPYSYDAISLLADSTGYGSLLYDSGHVKAMVSSFVKGGKLGSLPAITHYVSCPVQDQTGSQLIDNSLGNYNVNFFKKNNWIRVFSTDTLIPGIGYNVAYNGNKQINYEGILVNDSVKVALYDTNNWSLIGNPYPCSINGVAFLNEIQNQQRLTGVLYFLSQTEYNNSDDYVLINLSGQLSQVRADYPAGIIARSQGFWVQNSGSNSVNCIFSNQMKTNGKSVLYANGTENISRCYLGLENKNGYFNKQLLAFTSEAGINYDKLYDAYSIEDTTKSPQSFYSFVKNNDYPFAIQGLNFKADSTIIQLGYYSGVSGLLTISLEKLSSFPDSLNLYLYDKELKTSTNLKKNNTYVFNSSAGRFNKRFKILIVPELPNAIENIHQTQNKWILKGNNLEINTQSDKFIESISVYNVYGQKVLIKEGINKPDFTINLNGYSGLLCIEAIINGIPEVRKFIVSP